MTLENFKYRTDPLFLRDQFSKQADIFGIPIIPKPYFSHEELQNLRLLGFDQVKRDEGKHKNRMVHFFLYDYKFEKLWDDPEPFVYLLHPYRAVLTPDFSMYTEMPPALQLYNTFRNRWCGAYLAEQGLRVVPTVSWGTEESFDFCFAGIEKGSIVAVSTYMFHAHGNHADQKELFMNGYRELLRRIQPEYVICYSDPFPEMEGNIIYVDYDLSSWKHMEDDIVPAEFVKHTHPVLTKQPVYDRIVKTGYVCKGGGSAYGGEWVPPPGSEWMLGEPNTTAHVTKTTNKGSYEMDVRYNADGKADYVRHYTDHSYPNHHTNPHDHYITWENGHPNWGSQINYSDPNMIPVFKIYKILGGDDPMKHIFGPAYTPDLYRFHTLSEFKMYLASGANVAFEFHGIEYGVEKIGDGFCIWICDGDELAFGITLEDVMNYELDGVKIRDLILDAEITERQ